MADPKNDVVAVQNCQIESLVNDSGSDLPSVSNSARAIDSMASSFTHIEAISGDLSEADLKSCDVTKEYNLTEKAPAKIDIFRGTKIFLHPTTRQNHFYDIAIAENEETLCLEVRVLPTEEDMDIVHHGSKAADLTTIPRPMYVWGPSVYDKLDRDQIDRLAKYLKTHDAKQREELQRNRRRVETATSSFATFDNDDDFAEITSHMVVSIVRCKSDREYTLLAVRELAAKYIFDRLSLSFSLTCAEGRIGSTSMNTGCEPNRTFDGQDRSEEDGERKPGDALWKGVHDSDPEIILKLVTLDSDRVRRRRACSEDGANFSGNGIKDELDVVFMGPASFYKGRTKPIYRNQSGTTVAVNNDGDVSVSSESKGGQEIGICSGTTSETVSSEDATISMETLRLDDDCCIYSDGPATAAATSTATSRTAGSKRKGKLRRSSVFSEFAGKIPFLDERITATNSAESDLAALASERAIVDNTSTNASARRLQSGSRQGFVSSRRSFGVSQQRQSSSARIVSTSSTTAAVGAAHGTVSSARVSSVAPAIVPDPQTSRTTATATTTGFTRRSMITTSTTATGTPSQSQASEKARPRPRQTASRRSLDLQRAAMLPKLNLTQLPGTNDTDRSTSDVTEEEVGFTGDVGRDVGGESNDSNCVISMSDAVAAAAAAVRRLIDADNYNSAATELSHDPTVSTPTRRPAVGNDPSESSMDCLSRNTTTTPVRRSPRPIDTVEAARKALEEEERKEEEDNKHEPSATATAADTTAGQGHCRYSTPSGGRCSFLEAIRESSPRSEIASPTLNTATSPAIGRYVTGAAFLEPLKPRSGSLSFDDPGSPEPSREHSQEPSFRKLPLPLPSDVDETAEKEGSSEQCRKSLQSRDYLTPYASSRSVPGTGRDISTSDLPSLAADGCTESLPSLQRLVGSEATPSEEAKREAVTDIATDSIAATISTNCGDSRHAATTTVLPSTAARAAALSSFINGAISNNTTLDAAATTAVTLNPIKTVRVAATKKSASAAALRRSFTGCDRTPVYKLDANYSAVTQSSGLTSSSKEGGGGVSSSGKGSAVVSYVGAGTGSAKMNAPSASVSVSASVTVSRRSFTDLSRL